MSIARHESRTTKRGVSPRFGREIGCARAHGGIQTERLLPIIKRNAPIGHLTEMNRLFHPLLNLIAASTDRALARYVEYLKEENLPSRTRRSICRRSSAVSGWVGCSSRERSIASSRCSHLTRCLACDKERAIDPRDIPLAVLDRNRDQLAAWRFNRLREQQLVDVLLHLPKVWC